MGFDTIPNEREGKEDPGMSMCWGDTPESRRRNDGDKA